MICFPNAKINLGLKVSGKRNDGFHTIETLIVPVAWYDCLEFRVSDQFSLHNYGLPIPGKTEDNLLYLVWTKMKTLFQIPPLELHLLKSIPPGAGLGGGSADAAFFITAINAEFGLGLSTKSILNLASEIGNDCTFSVLNEPCMAIGTGNQLKPIKLELKNFFLQIVKPSLTISTSFAYSLITPSKSAHSISKTISLPMNKWPSMLVNDFEVPIFRNYPEIESIKNKLYTSGAIYASLSGSGSAVYGIFEKKPEREIPFPGCQVRAGYLFLN
jgi:4-diphosphocytidyl-2-C-methyl-D-erythritol kinase